LAGKVFGSYNETPCNLIRDNAFQTQHKKDKKAKRASLLKLQRSGRIFVKTEPHKHNNYFEIIYLSKGSGTHTIDYNSYKVQPPVIFFVRKEQVHHWELLTTPEGFVLILKKAFIDKSLDNELKSLLTKVSSLSSLQVKDTDTINTIFQLLTKEGSNINESNFHVVEGLLKALLAKMLEVAKPHLAKAKTNSDLFLSFRELLSQTGDIKNNVAHYAALLNTTPQNLNTACRKSTNQSASEILAEHIVSEAKKAIDLYRQYCC